MFCCCTAWGQFLDLFQSMFWTCHTYSLTSSCKCICPEYLDLAVKVRRYVCSVSGETFSRALPRVHLKRRILRSSLVAYWLGFWALTAKGLGSTPGWGTEIPQPAQCDQKKKKSSHVGLLRNIWLFFFSLSYPRNPQSGIWCGRFTSVLFPRVFRPPPKGFWPFRWSPADCPGVL